jgi:hypothetical protein
MNQEERNRWYLDSLVQAQKEVADALKARDESQSRLDRAGAAYSAWKIILEQAGLSEHQAKPCVEEQRQAPTRKRAARVIAIAAEDDVDNKADFVRTAIMTAGPSGITPAEIKTAATNSGIEGYKGYPYTVIYKMKKSGKVGHNAKGRLIWIET